MMSGRCPECDSQIVWRADGEVCCSKCGLVIEKIMFEKVSDDVKSRFYKPGLLEWFRWKTAKEKRRERRERGPQDACMYAFKVLIPMYEPLDFSL